MFGWFYIRNSWFSDWSLWTYLKQYDDIYLMQEGFQYDETTCITYGASVSLINSFIAVCYRINSFPSNLVNNISNIVNSCLWLLLNITSWEYGVYFDLFIKEFFALVSRANKHLSKGWIKNKLYLSDITF